MASHRPRWRRLLSCGLLLLRFRALSLLHRSLSSRLLPLQSQPQLLRSALRGRLQHGGAAARVDKGRRLLLGDLGLGVQALLRRS